jgi:hypothetical protein
MVESVSLNELGNFLSVLLSAYDSYIYFAFVLMIFFNIAIFTKYLISGTR